MLAPKDLLDALSGHASRILSGDTPLPKSEIESQFKALLQSGFSKLDLVSREEFDSQMVVLARTRARLERPGGQGCRVGSATGSGTGISHEPATYARSPRRIHPDGSETETADQGIE